MCVLLVLINYKRAIYLVSPVLGLAPVMTTTICNRSKRIILDSGGFERLQMVSGLDIARSVWQ